MQYREWKFSDKSDWGPGSWQDEPDKIQFTDVATGYPCLIVRNRVGALCGYVGLPEGHACYGQEYGAPQVDVHGGLTFSSHCQQPSGIRSITRQVIEKESICHIPDPGESDNVWWLGFDCAHFGDLAPEMRAYERQKGRASTDGESYRTIDYVKAEIAHLAIQLYELA